jgi:hypothetical protein
MKAHQPGGEEFLAHFRAAYPTLSSPRFYIGVIEDAVLAAAAKGIPLLLFVHDPRQSAIHASFVEHTICHPEAITLLARLLLFI